MADIGVGGFVAPCNRWAVWRYVIAFLRSPLASSRINCRTCPISRPSKQSIYEVELLTPSSACTPSAPAIISILA